MKSAFAKLRRTLRDQRARLALLVPKARKRASEADVHRLRVLTRRLRALLRLLKPVKGAAPARRASRRLRTLGRALGERRMWDVAFAGMPGLVRQPERFEPKRAAASRLLARELNRIYLDALLEELKAASKAMRAAQGSVVAERAAKLRRALERCEGRAPRHVDARHALRLDIKKSRYLLEACGVDAPQARGLQALLGHEHDLYMLLVLAGRNRRVKQLEAQARAATDAAAGSALRETLALLKGLQRAFASRD